MCINNLLNKSNTKGGNVALKSANLFFAAPQRKLRFSKAQWRSLRFKLLDVTFFTGFGMTEAR
jgi:hypothetical protein